MSGVAGAFATPCGASTDSAGRRTRRYGARARIGLIVPPTNTVNESEFHRAVPAEVSVHATRMRLHVDIQDAAGQAALFDDLRAAIALLVPARVDVIVHACTAGSLLLPLERITDFMREAAGVPAIATASALVHACRALGAQRVAVATPYHEALNAHEVSFLRGAGLDVLGCRGMGIGAAGAHEYQRIATLRDEEILAHVVASDHPQAQALIVSCTDLPTLDLIGPLERAVGKPVVTSNMATLWAALRAAGIVDRLNAGGRLLRG